MSLPPRDPYWVARAGTQAQKNKFVRDTMRRVRGLQKYLNMTSTQHPQITFERPSLSAIPQRVEIRTNVRDISITVDTQDASVGFNHRYYEFNAEVGDKIHRGVVAAAVTQALIDRENVVGQPAIATRPRRTAPSTTAQPG